MLKKAIVISISIFTASFCLAQNQESAPSISLDSAEIQFPSLEAALGKNFTTTTTMYLSSNYVSRGISQTKNRPAIQGSYDLMHSSGVSLGGFVSNVDLDPTPIEKTKTEADLYLIYNGQIGSVNWGAMALWYTYLENSKINFAEYTVFARHRFLKLDVAYAPDYAGIRSSSLYTRLSATARLNKKDLLVASAGQTVFSNDDKVGYKSYNDYKLSLTHTAADFTTEFAYTDTDREDLTGKGFLDRAISIILSRTF